MHVLKVILVLAIGFAAVWAITLSVRIEAAYVSVQNAGYRFSSIVPTGSDIGSHQFSNQYVRVEPATYYTQPHKRPAFVEPPLEPSPRAVSAQKERIALAGVITAVALLAMLTLVFASRERSTDDRDTRRRRLLHSAVVISGCGVVLGGAFMFFRVFLTGVDNALIARATEIGTDAQAYFHASETLSMSWPTLVMLYLGLAMIAYPIMTGLGLRCMGISKQARTDAHRDQDPAPMLVHRIMNGVFASCYVVLTLTFLLSPWTNTILGTILIS
ncbi:MAG: hypothetical protein ACX94C_13240 [Phycisphaerales bacterium]